MNLHAPATKTEAPAFQRYEAWLKTIPASSTTGWRWRREGMVNTINIAGRCYISAEEIARFLARAESGEFAKEHKVPTPATVNARAA